MIFSNYQTGIGRELHIHHQQLDGSFSPTPQRIEIKTEIIAVGFADLRPDPGKELVLVSNSGVFSLSTAQEGYAGNIRQLFEWDLIATIPDLEQVQFFEGIEDINRDGKVDFLLPGDGQYGFFVGEGNEQYQQLSEFSTINENQRTAQRNTQQGELSLSLIHI